jgi:hypothetical protein
MESNTPKNQTFFVQAWKTFKKFFKSFRKTTKKHQSTLQKIQLTFIYFFATVVLMYSIRNSLGYFPEILFKIVPFSEQILGFSFFKILATPEKIYILYLLVIEFIIVRPIFNFSVLVKFNVLLIFLFEMLQNLIISYWDLLFIREADILHGDIIPKYATILFFCIFFASFFLLYLYCYVKAFRGSLPSFQSIGILQKVVDSVAFWLRIKPAEEDKKKS